MKKSKIITILIFLAVILTAVVLFLIGNKKNIFKPVNKNQTDDWNSLEKYPLNTGIGYHVCEGENSNDCIEKEYWDKILGNKEDLISFSIWPNAKVHGILSYRGVIEGGYFFEANILINILDLNKKVLKASNGIAKSEWMTSGPVNFEGYIDFTGFPKGPAYFEIHNDNASGLPENDKSILIPIIIE